MHFHRVASMRKALALLFAGLTPIPAFVALIAYKIWLDPIVALAAPDVARASMVALAGSVIVSAGLGSVLGWRLAMSIDDPLRHCIRRTIAILSETDNETGPVPYVDFQGAIGTLARQADRSRKWLKDRQVEMVAKTEEAQKSEEARRMHEEALAMNATQQTAVVASLASGLSRLASGDLAFRIEEAFPESYQAVKDDFNGAMEQLQAAMRSLAVNAMGIRASTDEISQSAEDLSRRTETQAASLEETAAALDQITITVRKTAEGATEASAVVHGAKTQAEESGHVVRDAVAAMSAIESSAQQISQIIGVIDEIAFQTNLLALNAGVEAARAGDAGRGFAVVASEVRALAQRSANAAKEIKALILTSTNQVASGVSLVGQAGQALRGILGKVGEINQLVADIAASAKDQAAGLHEINTSINQMDHVTQQNAAIVQESTAACFALASEAQQLAKLIEGFEIGEIVEARPVRKLAPAPAPRLEAPQSHPVQQPVYSMRTVGSGGAARKIEVSEDGWEEF